MLVNFSGNWMTLSPRVNFTRGKAREKNKNTLSHLEAFYRRLQVLRLNEFCPTFHNYRCVFFLLFPSSFPTTLFFPRLNCLRSFYLTYLKRLSRGRLPALSRSLHSRRLQLDVAVTAEQREEQKWDFVYFPPFLFQK